ncbi:MAG: hypothetical protein ABIE47_14785 [Pseudomonadota bacterium]
MKKPNNICLNLCPVTDRTPRCYELRKKYARHNIHGAQTYIREKFPYEDSVPGVWLNLLGGGVTFMGCSLAEEILCMPVLIENLQQEDLELLYAPLSLLARNGKGRYEKT